MAKRSDIPRARFSISCRESDWERIREIAARRGVSINDHIISAGLTAEPRPGEPEARPLSGAERRRLARRVDLLAGSMLAEAGRGAGAIARLRQAVELVLAATLRDLVRQGRGHEIGPLLSDMFDPEHGPEVERQFRAWMERGPPAE